LVGSHENSSWSGGIYAHAWSSRVAELEERVVSAKRYEASMLEIAEKAERYAEEMGSLREVEEIAEVNPQFWITWGSAVYHARVKAEEYMAAAEIAQGKVDLGLARAAKARIGAEWARGIRESAE